MCLKELHTTEKTKLITQLGDAKNLIEQLEQDKVGFTCVIFLPLNSVIFNTVIPALGVRKLQLRSTEDKHFKL